MITAVVLAAGSSSRMGRPKQLIELGGKPLLQHAVDLATARFDDAVLVLGHEADEVESTLELSPRVKVIRNPEYPSGQESSVRAGLLAVPEDSDAAAFFLGDQPTMSRAFVDEVIEAFASSSASVVRPGTSQAPGHPVLVRRGAIDEWRRRGQGSTRELMRGHQVAFIHTSSPQPEDVDTPEDLVRVRREGSP